MTVTTTPSRTVDDAEDEEDGAYDQDDDGEQAQGTKRR